ncbi:thioredoxin family protein [Idiomarina abyssalis]|uniref:thioredoxin family protein n=1 Tax=Idiomarina abyssalis TaxID=86102 RepID=UPI003A8CF2CF
MKYLYIIASFIVMPSFAQEWEFSGQSIEPEEARELQQRAAEQGKNLMLVLGASWCGDSNALIEQFNQPQFKKQLKQYYQVQLVDVGYFERGYELVSSYGEPVYYGTPTVIIVDAISGNIKNFDDWQYWTNASKRSAESFNEYFFGKALRDDDDSHLSQIQREQLASFKERQGERIKAGYDWVAPYLKEYKNSGAKKPPQSFIEKWVALARFRNQVHSDIVAAYEQGRAAPSKPLELPSYPAQDWESL